MQETKKPNFEKYAYSEVLELITFSDFFVNIEICVKKCLGFACSLVVEELNKFPPNSDKDLLDYGSDVYI